MRADARSLSAVTRTNQRRLRPAFRRRSRWSKPQAFAADGTLSRTDLVFSRDSSPRRYVQHLVAENAPELAAWVERGASILVCGGLEMAAGVQDALVAILGQEKLDAMTEAGLYRRDIY